MRQETKERLRSIYNLFQKVPGNELTFHELQTGLSNCGYPLKDRQLYKDLATIQNGIDDIAFTINFDKKRKKYVLVQTSKINVIEEDQRSTLPILLSILQPYSYLPAVGVLYDTLKKQFGKKYINLLNIIKLHNKSRSQQYQKDAIKWSNLAIQLVKHIENKEAVQFNYFQPYSNQGNFWLIKLFPIQIRIFEGRYYLFGIPVTKDFNLTNIRSYPLDCIVNYKIELLDEEEKTNKFTLPRNFIMSLDQLMNGCIGIMRPKSENPELKTFCFEFKGWAASLVERVPLHHSQKILEIGKDHIKLSLEIYETDDINFVIKRFREYAEPVKC